MMIKYFLPLAFTALPMQCATDSPPVPPPPAPAACAGHIVILDSRDAPLDCDISPPQILGYFTDDPGPIQVDDCNNSGGQLIYTRFREICIDIDY